MADAPISVKAWRIFSPVHPDGHKFVALGFVAALTGFFLWAPLGWILLALSLCIALFFRDPQRCTPQNDGLIIAPADGLITATDKAHPPAELDMEGEEMQRVSIFLSLLDCHVNRAPAGGLLRRIICRPGRFLAAGKPQAGSDNERRCLLLETADGRRVVCVQIAGLLARRIVTTAREGDKLPPGGRIGLIRFGSRVDVYFDPSMRLLAGVGQRAIGGETILAEMPSHAEASGERRFLSH